MLSNIWKCKIHKKILKNTKNNNIKKCQRVYELQMLDEGMSRPRRPIFKPQTFRSVVGIEGNEFVLKSAFVGVSNDLYVFVVVMKLRHEVSDALLNHLSLRVMIEEYCI